MKQHWTYQSNLSAGYCLAFFLLFITLSPAQAQTSPYTFEPVTIGGGGYITNIAKHPANADLMYIRTDVGGCYRWDHTSERWVQLLNSLTPETRGFNSVDGMALAATDQNVIYIAAGNARNEGDLSDVLKSTNQGQNWTRTNFGVDQAFEGNQRDVRYTGERIAVDPRNAEYVYVGTKLDGLYRSQNGADSWSRLGDIPRSTVNSTAKANVVGVRNIVFDPRQTTGSGANRRSKTVYVGAYEDGVYRSTDGGNNFTRMSGSPETPRRMVVAGDGSLWVTTGYPQGSDATALGGGRVYHYTGGTWVDKTPEAPDFDKPYGAIAIDPDNDDRVIVAWQKNNSNQPIYRTENATDASPTWTQISPGFSASNKSQPGWWEDHFFGTGPANIIVDPANTDEIWMTDGFGVWNATNVWATDKQNITWTARVAGIEELVMMTLATPPAPNPTALFSGAADADGFAHNNLNQSPSETLQPGDWATTALDYVASNPRHMIRLLTAKTSGGEAYWSEDSGVTWNKTASDPRSGSITLGKAAVSATTLDKMVVVPAYNAWEIGEQAVTLKYTDDRGATWKNTNLTFSPGPIDNWWAHDHPVVADQVDGNTFYFFYKRKSEFYRSTDGGQTFQLLHTFPNHEAIWGKPTKYWEQWVYVRTVPGSAGEVWISLPQDGLFKSADGGEHWTRVDGFENVRGLTFGKPAPGSSSSSVYVLADAGDGLGLFTSDDRGGSWFRCDDDGFNFGIPINDIRADKQTYGRVYVATGGRGIVRADRGSNPPPAVDFKPSAKIVVDSSVGDRPLTVNFDASGSSDPDGGGLTYAWDFGDGSNGTGVSPAHTYLDYGTYTATLSVTNGSGESATAATGITVNALPTVAWASPSDGDNFVISTSVTLSVNVSDANGAADIDRVIFWDKDFNFLGNDKAGPDYTFEATIEAGPNEFYAEVYDQQNSKSLTPLLVLVGGEASPSDWVYGVNAGGNGVQDEAGYLYYGDEHFVGGGTHTTTDPISGTTDDALYQSERVGNPLSYNLPTGQGTFDVTLKMAELGWDAVGERVFDIAIEGTTVATDVDIYARAGHDAAYDMTFEGISVTDGSLNIRLEGSVRSPKVNAVLVKTATAPSATFPLAGTQYLLRHASTGRYLDSGSRGNLDTKRSDNNGSSDRLFEFVANGDTHWIINGQSGRNALRTEPDGRVSWMSEDRPSGDDKQWEVIAAGDDQYYIRNQHANRDWLAADAGGKVFWTNTQSLDALWELVDLSARARVATPSPEKAIGWPDGVSEAVMIYPNPARDMVYLRLSADKGEATITLTDMLGREVLQYHTTKSEMDVPLQKLWPGVYQVSVQQAEGRTTKRLVIE